jgi:hypothetical protein
VLGFSGQGVRIGILDAQESHVEHQQNNHSPAAVVVLAGAVCSECVGLLWPRRAHWHT